MPEKPPDSPSMFAAARAVFGQAWQLPPEQRADFVRTQCQGRDGLADYVLELLQTAANSTIPLWNANSPDDAGAEPIRSAAVDDLLQKLEQAPRLAGERYQLEGEVGRGGMGVVLRYRDQHLNRPLALKTMLQPGSLVPPENPWVHTHMLGRFLEEAQITSQLEHPGVIPVHELGLDHDGQAYFTMRLVRGLEAREVFALAHRGEQEWTITRALEVILKVCDTMAYAHGRGVVHRDLKPGNIMVGDFGEVYVMDWGLAKILDQGVATAEAGTATAAGVDTVRQREAHRGPDSPLQSLRGQRVGTPSYMAPEQARGEAVDGRADVYAISAMLYELLAGRAPYARPGEEIDSEQVLSAVLLGPPIPVAELSERAPAPLVAIVEKGMARDPDQRYADTRQLAADVRAFLDQRSVGAYHTGALVELKLWIRRNRPLAASLAAALLLLVLGTVGITAFAKDAEVSAKERDATKRSLDHLATLQRYETAVVEAHSLVPAWPHMLPQIDAWLAHADLLSRNRASIAEELAHQTTDPDLWTSTGREVALEVQTQEAYLRSLRQSLAIREGKRTAQEILLSDAQMALPADQKRTYANRCVALVPAERTVPDQEPLGLALARAALRENQDAHQAAEFLRTLAMALLANGSDDEAVACIQEACSKASADQQETFHILSGEIRHHVEQRANLIAAAETELARLQALASRHRSLFTADSKAFVNAKLRDIKGMLDNLERVDRPRIERRQTWARQVATATFAHPEAKHSWAEVRAAIERADGITASTQYAGKSIPLEDEQVMGLVPIGMNPATKLWEFYDLRSGWDGKCSATAIPIPEHDPSTGDVHLTEETGMVLVLLPGGDYTMGAQRVDPAMPNYDPLAVGEEPPHRESVDPFFLARHEMTQGQWKRLWSGSDELRTPSSLPAGRKFSIVTVTMVHPVESVDAVMADTLLHEHGMLLPTEVQWEYACRAGSTTPWSTGDRVESLEGHANIHDQSSAEHPLGWGTPAPFRDGYVSHAPVGSFTSNAFGLHDMHGNVREWCRDWDAGYAYPTVPGSGLRLSVNRTHRINRGGAYASQIQEYRSAARNRSTPTTRHATAGCRAARSLQPRHDQDY